MPIGVTWYRLAALAAALALGACSSAGGNDLAALDDEAIDPALTSALEDPILVDPDLVQQAHPNTVRPPEMPVQAQYPASIEPKAAERLCRSLEQGDHWAARLPAQFPAYPGARLTEAAGSDSGGCRVRMISFETADPYQRVLGFYRAAAARAGFSARHQQRGTDHMLAGASGPSGGGFALVVTPLEHGSAVSLIVNSGQS